MVENPIMARRVKGGVKLAHHKNTASKQTVFMPAPEKVTIPMRQHIGAPCAVAVKVNDEVKVGTLIGSVTAPFCAPIYSSVSGKVTRICDITLADGSKSAAVEITSDGLNTPDESISRPVIEDLEGFLEAIKNSGLVGLGGAGFPTHIKLTPVEGKEIDTLIINCAECEPYITADHRECLENTWDILNGVYTLKEMLNIPKAYIAVEDNKPDAIKNLLEIAGDEKYDPDDVVKVVELKSSYPQGAEKVMVKAVTGREIPIGKLPSDVGVLLMNVTSVAFISRYIKTGMPLVSKRVTVDGNAVENPQNVIVPIGTSVADVLKFVGLKSEPKKILMGGPMMGTAISSDAVPVVKTTNAILAFDEKQAHLNRETACIRCGRCVKNCPMGLLPLNLVAAASREETDELRRLNVMACMECGTCVYGCPASRRIVQSIRIGKKLVREDDAKKKEAAGK